MIRKEIETDEFDDLKEVDLFIKFVGPYTSIQWFGGSSFFLEKQMPGLASSRQPATADQIEDLVKTAFAEQPKSESVLRMVQGAAIEFKRMADQLNNKSRNIMNQLEEKGLLKTD